MAFDNFKTKLIELFQEDEEEMFKVLDRHLKPEGETYGTFLLLKKQFSSIKRDIRNGLVGGYVDQNFQQTKVWNAIIAFINTIRTEDLRTEKPFTVLILCKDEPDKARMAQIFSALPLTVTVEISSNNPEMAAFSLLVYDNHNLGAIPNEGTLTNLPMLDQTHLNHMINMLETGTKWILHYGEYCYRLNDFREVSSAANNKYTLYARILEMKKYMEDYQIGRAK